MGERNHAIVIAESLARVIDAIRISLAFIVGHISLENTEISPHRPCVRCAAIRIARWAFIRLAFVPHGTAEWLARVDCVRWTLAIGDWRFCPSKPGQDIFLVFLLEIRPNPNNENRNVIKKGFVQFAGGPLPVAGPSIPLMVPSVSLTGSSVAPTGALFNCL